MSMAFVSPGQVVIAGRATAVDRASSPQSLEKTCAAAGAGAESPV
jgi:hypothetical protein